jgi:hypothetical protein
VGDCLLNHVKIPREIIYGKDIGDKRVIIFSYLCSRRALDDTVAFSISELCHWSRLQLNSHDGKVNQKYLTALASLSRYGYFIDFPDFNGIAIGKKNVNSYYNVKINTRKFDTSDNFGIIYRDELERILNFKEELREIGLSGRKPELNRMYSSYILLLLSYLRVNMNRNLDRPLCCYRLYKTISEDIGLSERYVTRIVKLLDEMGIVKVQEGKRTRYKNKEDKYGFITAPKIFADYRRYIKDDNGEPMIDKNYNYMTEIQKQLDILETNQRDRTKEILIEE